MSGKNEKEELKGAAFDYWQRGCRIVSLIGKSPLTKWERWQKEEQTLQKFEELPWDRANAFAVICGVRLNNDFYVGVLDLDVEKAGKPLPQEVLEKQGKVVVSMPVTQLEETPSGGRHLVYYSKAPIQTKTYDYCGVEILGEDKLCIMAPSTGYKRLNDNMPTEVQNLHSNFEEALEKAGFKPPKTFSRHRVRRRKAPVRYCCETTLERDRHISHLMRLAIAAEYKKAGWSEDDIVNLFRSQADFDREKCLTQVKSADPERAATCETIEGYGYCYPECQEKTSAKNRKQDNVKISPGQSVQNDVEPVALEHLTMIEDPAVADLPVIVGAVVSSTSISYLVPKTIQTFITDKNGNEECRTIEIGERNPINIKFVGINEDVKYRRLKRFVEEAVNEPSSKIRVEEQKWRTIYKIRVRPPVFTLEKREGKILDEKGFEYKSYDVYICADKPITFEASSLVRLKGIVLPNPHTQNTTLLVYEVEFPEEFHSFNVEMLEKLRIRFKELSVQGRIDWILSNFEVYSQIIERQNLAFEGFLTFFTPTYIELNGRVERGWGDATAIGDTTTAKSETIKKLILLLKAGMLITAETASAVGLVGAAIQSERGQWTVEWGFLVLNDRKLLAIDGAHKLPFSQWAALSESERSGVVTIAKAAKNSAYARTRQIKIANAVDREADKFSTKAMKSFLYPAQALSTVFDKTGIARLDLAVFADSRDVKAKDVNQQRSLEYDRDLELLGEAIRWCWSNKAKVEFTPEAFKEILNAATALYEKYFSDSVPLTSIDMKWKLARLSAALAFMVMSTEDYETVTVTAEHVKAIVAFIEEEYSTSGLNTLAQEDKYETITLEDAELLIARVTNQTEISHDVVMKILKFIVLQGRVTKDQLKSRFDLADKNQLRPLLAILESEKLLRGGRGYYPTSKLIETYKILPPLPPLPLSEKNPSINGKEESEQPNVEYPFSEVGKQGKRGKNTMELDSSVVASPVSTTPLLTKENVDKVLSALAGASRVRGSAHTSEIVLETKLSESDVPAILQQLQREGKAISIHSDWWKVT
jgi:hypothetical protein